MYHMKKNSDEKNTAEKKYLHRLPAMEIFTENRFLIQLSSF